MFTAQRVKCFRLFLSLSVNYILNSESIKYFGHNILFCGVLLLLLFDFILNYKKKSLLDEKCIGARFKPSSGSLDQCITINYYALLPAEKNEHAVIDIL